MADANGRESVRSLISSVDYGQAGEKSAAG